MIFDAESFSSRHIGPDSNERDQMLKAVGAPTLDALMDEAIPPRIRLSKPLNLAGGASEAEYLTSLREIASKNQVFKSYLGLGYYDCVTPSVILRNVLENPGWYTPYTPYQAEIAQGRLEALINFQTMVADLTGMDIANASLLDEATAAAEAMTMLHRVSKSNASKFFVSDSCFPQTIDVLKTRAEPLGIELVIGDRRTAQFDSTFFGAMAQTPDEAGLVHDLSDFVARAKKAGVLTAIGSDLLALVMLTPPDADEAFGNGLRRPARGIFRHQTGSRAPGAGANHRRQRGCARQHGVSHGAGDAGAAYPAREGDFEHLHGAGAAGQHRGTVRGVSRAERLDGDRAAGARVREITGARTGKSRRRAAQRILLRHAAAGTACGGDR